jgi:hypothetical protein
MVRVVYLQFDGPGGFGPVSDRLPSRACIVVQCGLERLGVPGDAATT